MAALPLTPMRGRLDFADLPELHAETEVRVFSTVLRPMGFTPLTGEHKTDDISTTSWLWHRDKGSISGQHPYPQWGDWRGWERMQRTAPSTEKARIFCHPCTWWFTLPVSQTGSSRSPPPGHPMPRVTPQTRQLANNTENWTGGDKPL